MTPLAIDLFCGLGGWTEGLLAEGYYVVGFDVERHRYPAYEALDGDGTKVGGIDFNGYVTPGYKPVAFNGTAEKRMRDSRGARIGWQEYPAQLVLQDVLTLHGSQFKDAALIVASPPCQEYSYMAMPWSRAKAIAAEYRSGARDVKKLTALFDACFRIQREAIEAAGRFIPLVVENVRGAQEWVGRSRWNFGSFHLWGDVPALMPITIGRQVMKAGITHRNDGSTNFHGHKDGLKGGGGTWFGDYQSGIKQGGDWFNDSQPSISRRCSSKSKARKAAAAAIAKIPLPLSQHIAWAWKPGRELCI